MILNAPNPASDRARPRAKARTGVLRRCLLARVAIAAIVAACAPAIAMAAPPPADDGLGSRDAYIEADTLINDRDSQQVVARGHVEARAQGRTVRADELIYNRQTGAVHAHGNAVLINGDGTVQYAEDIELDDRLRAGVATGFAARLDQNVTIAAGAAIRRTETVQQLNQAIFTPCNICEADGTPKTPSWSIQASRIVQDSDHHVIYYRNAVVRIKNIPVLYFPLFWTADPAAERRSGFLTPRVELSGRRGLSYEQPYYFAISPSADLTASLQINTRVKPLANVQYRQRFYSGAIDLRAGVTYEKNFTSKLFFDNDTPRSYILGTGKFDIDKNWIWGFGLERVTDPTFFRRYNIGEVFIDRGPFPTDSERLISQIYTRRQDARSFVSVAALSFQSIRTIGQNPTTGAILGENSRTFPVVAPLIEARYDPEAPIFGGRLRAQLNAVSLNRSRTVTSIIDPSGLLLPGGPLQNPSLIPVLAPAAKSLSYSDSRRVSGQVDWRRAFTVGPGVRVQPFLVGRSDLYLIGSSSAKKGEDDFVTRTLGTAGADVSWPLYRTFGKSSLVVEPVAQLAASPLVGPSARIPNEDSVSLSFDDSTLFAATNRFSGFDLYEGGVRLNTGLRANAYFPTGTANLLVGRVFRTEENPAFNARSGLRGTASDWIVTAGATFPGFNVVSKSRLDSETLAVRRQEVSLNAARGPISFSGNYLYNESGLVIGPTGAAVVGRVHSVSFYTELKPLKHFGATALVVRDLDLKVFPRTQLGVYYQDECIRVDVVYTHDEYFGRVDTSNSIGVRLTLATLGDTSPRGVNRGLR